MSFSFVSLPVYTLFDHIFKVCFSDREAVVIMHRLRSSVALWCIFLLSSLVSATPAADLGLLARRTSQKAVECGGK